MRRPHRDHLATILLSDGIETSMRVVGQEELNFTREAGSGMVFPSELWHRTERPGGVEACALLWLLWMK